MSDQDMSLNLEITGDASSAVSAVEKTDAAMAALPSSVGVSQSAFDKLSASLENIVKQHGFVADSAAKAGGSVKSVGEAASTAAKEGGEWNSVAGDMARAFSSIGLQSGEAASRIGALGGALESLKTAAPELIVAVAGVVAGISGFEIAKDAIAAASDLQTSMTRLGQVVKDSGGNWSILSMQVKQYVDAQVESTTYTDTSVINSLERLVASGMSVKDAMTSTRIAEDLAAGSGRSLEEATNGLIEATHGRLMGLEAMGILTKQQVKDGMSYDAVLQEIESHMGGSAQTATQTYAGALSHLSAEWQKLLEDAGTPFLGLLAKIVNSVAEVVSELDSKLQPSFRALSDWAASQIPNVVEFFRQLWETIQYLGHEMRDVAGSNGVGALDSAFGDLRTVLDAVESSLTNGKTGWEGFRDLIGQVAQTVKTLVEMLQQADNWLNNVTTTENRFAANMQTFWSSPEGHAAAILSGTPVGALMIGTAAGNATQTAVSAAGAGAETTSGVAPRFYGSGVHPSGSAAAALPNTHTNYDPFVGGPTSKKKSSGAGAPAYQPLDLVEPTALTGVDKAAASANAAVKDLAISEQTLKDAMNADGTEAQYLIDKQKLYAASVSGTEAVIAKLSQAHKVENDALAKLNPEVDAARAHYNALAAEYNAADKALSATSKPTKEQTKAVHDLHTEAEQAKKSFDDLSKQQSKIATDLSHTNDELAKQKAALAALNDQISDTARQFDDFQQKQREQTYESISIIGMSTSQLYAHYSQEYAADYALWMQYQQAKNVTMMQKILPEMEKAEQDANAQYVKLYQEDYNAKMQFENEAASRMAAFVQAIVLQHQSMANSLKTVYQDIQKWFIDMIAQMMAKALMAMPVFQSILAMFGLGGGGGIPGIQYLVPMGPGGLGWGSGVGGNAVAAGGSAVAALSSSPTIAGAMAAAMSPSGGGGSVASGMFADGGMSPNVAFGGGNPLGYGGTGSSTSYGAPGGSSLTAGGASPYSQNAAASPLGLTNALQSVLKGPLGKVAMGLGLGDVGAAMTGGNQTWGSIGGGLAAGLGLLGVFAHANPLVGIGFDLLMGVIGGMFGNHFNAANEPDISQTSAWGQANADMQGMTAADPMIANGQKFTMDSQTSSATKGLGWNLLFEKFVQQYRGNLSSLPYTLQAAFPEIASLWGGATDKPFFNPDGKDGYLDIGSGKRALWTEFWRLVQNQGSAVSQIMNGSSPTEMYVTSTNGAMQGIGSGTPSPGGNGSPFAVAAPGGGSGGSSGSNAVAAGGAGRIGASLAERLSQAIAINVNVRNSSTLTDTSNLTRAIRDAFATTLPSALEDLNVR